MKRKRTQDEDEKLVIVRKPIIRIPTMEQAEQSVSQNLNSFPPVLAQMIKEYCFGYVLFIYPTEEIPHPIYIQLNPFVAWFRSQRRTDNYFVTCSKRQDCKTAFYLALRSHDVFIRSQTDWMKSVFSDARNSEDSVDDFRPRRVEDIVEWQPSCVKKDDANLKDHHAQYRKCSANTRTGVGRNLWSNAHNGAGRNLWLMEIEEMNSKEIQRPWNMCDIGKLPQDWSHLIVELTSESWSTGVVPVVCFDAGFSAGWQNTICCVVFDSWYIDFFPLSSPLF
jgi:hypothetical protein